MSYKDQCISASDQALLEWYECYKQIYPDYLGLDLAEQAAKLTANQAFDVNSIYDDEPEYARKSRAKALFENEINYKNWLDSNEAAAFLGISVGVLRNEASNGKVPYYKYGRRNRYLKSELEKLLSANKRGDF